MMRSYQRVSVGATIMINEYLIKLLNLNIDKARERNYIQEGYYLENGYYHSGDIILCPFCEHKVDKTNIYTDECHGSPVESEYDYTCVNCKEVLGHFSYGNYEYYFLIKDLEEE